jgi:FkbM family methyltransferase
MTKTRINVLKHWLLKNRNGVSFIQLLKFFFDKSYNSKSKAKIKYLVLKDDYYLVYFNYFNNPLFFPQNFSLKSLEQVIVESFYPNNWHYYEILQTKVTKEDTVVDCGAAEGLFGFLVVDRCEKLYLVEPLPAFCKAMEKTFARNKNVKILPVALSNKEMKAQIFENDISSSLSSGNGGIEVNVTTLDKLFYEKGEKITYIKIDLEGNDYEALLGGENIIRKNKPKIVVTTYHKAQHTEEITAYLKYLVPEYSILTKGIYQETGSPIMLHAWIESDNNICE